MRGSLDRVTSRFPQAHPGDALIKHGEGNKSTRDVPQRSFGFRILRSMRLAQR